MSDRRQFFSEATRVILGAGIASAMSSSDALASTMGPEGGSTGLVDDERYEKHVLDRGGSPHPETPLRLVKIREMFQATGLTEELVPIEPLESSELVLADIEVVHTKAHVASVQKIDVTGPIAELAVGGAVAAVDAVSQKKVRNAFCAIRPPGHHANNTGAEEGFCFYSNAAIAAKHAQSAHGFEKVLVIDWDYHHGNGTQNTFYDDPTVLFYSSHDWHAYPGTGDPSLVGSGDATGLNINVHLDCGSRDADMLREWERQLVPAAAKFKPDFIIISAGFDSRRDDLLGCFDVSDDAFRRMTRTAMDIANDYCDGRIVSLLEGGYNLDGLARAATAHVETLRDDA